MASIPAGRRSPAIHQSGSAVVTLFLCPQIFENGLECIDDLVARRPALVEAQFQVEGFGGRLEGEYVMLWAAGLRLGGCIAELLTRGAALARDLLDQRRHFVWCILPNDLQKQ